MDITGARWGLDGAEAILKLRALHSNRDFNSYWEWHLALVFHEAWLLSGAPKRKNAPELG